MSEGERLEYPMEPTARDHGHRVARTVVSAIPWAGGPILEVMNALMAPPLNKRRDAFFLLVGERILELEKTITSLSSERLGTNEAFISACATAMLIAVKTHQEEKLEALVNATLNSALEVDLDGTREFMFMRWIDELTPLHVHVLRVLNDPENTLASVGVTLAQDASISYREMLDRFLPGVFLEDALPLQIIKDLKSRGLIDDTLRVRGNDDMDMPAFRPRERPTVPELGLRFMAFIEKPTSVSRRFDAPK